MFSSFPCVSEATNGEEPATSLLMHKIFTTLGPPRTYSPSPQEVKEEETRIAEEKMKKEAEERAVEEQKEEEEARNRTARWEEWVGGHDSSRRNQTASCLMVYVVHMRSIRCKCKTVVM